MNSRIRWFQGFPEETREPIAGENLKRARRKLSAKGIRFLPIETMVANLAGTAVKARADSILKPWAAGNALILPLLEVIGREPEQGAKAGDRRGRLPVRKAIQPTSRPGSTQPKRAANVQIIVAASRGWVRKDLSRGSARPNGAPQLKNRWLFWLIAVGAVIGCVVSLAMGYLIMWWLPD